MKHFFQLGGVILGLTLTSIQFVNAQCYQGEDGRYYNLDGTPCTNTVVSAVPFLRIISETVFVTGRNPKE